MAILVTRRGLGSSLLTPTPVVTLSDRSVGSATVENGYLNAQIDSVYGGNPIGEYNRVGFVFDISNLPRPSNPTVTIDWDCPGIRVQSTTNGNFIQCEYPESPWVMELVRYISPYERRIESFTAPSNATSIIIFNAINTFGSGNQPLPPNRIRIYSLTFGEYPIWYGM